MVLALFISIPQLLSRPVYLAFIAIFTFVLADDALRLHEQLSVSIAAALDLPPFGGLRAKDSGELLVWIMAGIPLLTAAAFAIVGSPENDRRNGYLLFGSLALLALFAVVADMAHVVLQSAFLGADDLFVLIEDGGEQITLSLICCLAILIHQEVRGRVQQRSVRDGGTRLAGRRGGDLGEAAARSERNPIADTARSGRREGAAAAAPSATVMARRISRRSGRRRPW